MIIFKLKVMKDQQPLPTTVGPNKPRSQSTETDNSQQHVIQSPFQSGIVEEMENIQGWAQTLTVPAQNKGSSRMARSREIKRQKYVTDSTTPGQTQAKGGLADLKLKNRLLQISQKRMIPRSLEQKQIIETLSPNSTVPFEEPQKTFLLLNNQQILTPETMIAQQKFDFKQKREGSFRDYMNATTSNFKQISTNEYDRPKKKDQQTAQSTNLLQTDYASKKSDPRPVTSSKNTISHQQYVFTPVLRDSDFTMSNRYLVTNIQSRFNLLHSKQDNFQTLMNSFSPPTSYDSLPFQDRVLSQRGASDVGLNRRALTQNNQMHKSQPQHINNVTREIKPLDLNQLSDKNMVHQSRLLLSPRQQVAREVGRLPKSTVVIGPQSYVKIPEFFKNHLKHRVEGILSQRANLHNEIASHADNLTHFHITDLIKPQFKTSRGDIREVKFQDSDQQIAYQDNHHNQTTQQSLQGYLEKFMGHKLETLSLSPSPSDEESKGKINYDKNFSKKDPKIGVIRTKKLKSAEDQASPLHLILPGLKNKEMNEAALTLQIIKESYNFSNTVDIPLNKINNEFFQQRLHQLDPKSNPKPDQPWHKQEPEISILMPDASKSFFTEESVEQPIVKPEIKTKLEQQKANDLLEAQKEDITEHLYTDIFKSWVMDTNVDIFQPKSTSHLDNMVKAPKDLVSNFEGRVLIEALEAEQVEQLIEQQKTEEFWIHQQAMLMLEQRVINLAQEKSFQFQDDANWIKKLIKETDNLFTATDMRTDASFLDTSPHRRDSSASFKKRMKTLKVKDPVPDTETQQLDHETILKKVVFDRITVDNFRESAKLFKGNLNLTVFSQYSLTKVSISLHLNHEAIRILRDLNYTGKEIQSVLPLDLFDDFEEDCHALTQMIKNTRFLKQKELKITVCISDSQGNEYYLKGYALEYVNELRKFLVDVNGHVNLVSRLRLTFDKYERIEQSTKRRNLADQKLREVFKMINMERIFFAEIAKLNTGIFIPSAQQDRIIKKAGQKNQKVEDLMLQVQAMYRHSLLKAIAIQQLEKQNPKYTCLVSAYSFESNQIHEPPFYALQAYERNHGPLPRFMRKKQIIEMLDDFSLQGNSKFNEFAEYLATLKVELLERTLMIDIPLQEKSLVTLSMYPKYSTFSHQQFKDSAESYPVDTLDFLTYQQDLTKYFRFMIKNTWQERIANHVDAMITKQFGKISNLEITEAKQLNPFLVRFFKLVNSQQINHLHEKLVFELKKYRTFLLKFANRNHNFINSAAYSTLELQSTLITLQQKPLLKLRVKISKSQANGIDQLTIKTEPKLDVTERLFIQFMNEMKGAVTDLVRIENMIFPNLRLGQVMLQVGLGEPIDGNKFLESQFSKLQQQITGIVQFILSQTELHLNSLYEHITYLGLSFADLLYQMRETSLGKEEPLMHGGKNYHVDDREEQLHKEAVERTPVTQEIYAANYKKILNAYWKSQFEIALYVDFGLVCVETSKFKQIVTKHFQNLIKDFKNHLCMEFDEQLFTINDKYKHIQDVVCKVHRDVDEIIKQLAYVAQLQAMNIATEMINNVQQLQIEKDFLDMLQIVVSKLSFEIYLNLHKLPKLLNGQITEKFQNLKEDQVKIEAMLESQSEEVQKKMTTFAERFQCFYDRGLQTKAELISLRINLTAQDIDKTIYFQNRFELDIAPLQLNHVWWQTYVYNLYDDFQCVMSQLEQCENDIKEIQRRQEGLHIEVTQFPIVTQTRQQIKQIASLWKTIESFNRYHWHWWACLLATLDLEEVEEKCNDWTSELTYIQRSVLIQQNVGPMSFVNYILMSIERIKIFLPVILAFKTLGLEYRHYHQMTKELARDIKPAKLKLKWIAKHQLHQGENLKIILRIADIASKEYQIKLTLDKIDTDLREQIMLFVPYKNSGTYIVLGMDEALSQTEDIQSKVLGLEKNIFARHFTDKIQVLVKLLRQMIEIMVLWKNVQKYWAYLIPIFCQDDVIHSMPREVDMFRSIDVSYQATIIKAYNGDYTWQEFSEDDGIHRLANSFKEKFELLMKSLSTYLMSKRGVFPRLYFLSNDEIIELIGSMDDTPAIQAKLYKMFDGCETIDFMEEQNEPFDFLEMQPGILLNPKMTEKSTFFPDKSQRIPATPSYGHSQKQETFDSRGKPVQQKVSNIGMNVIGVRNPQGEQCKFETQFNMSSRLEQFLLEIENAMQNSVIKEIVKCELDYRKKDFMTWIQLWPSQLLLVSLDIQMTKDLEPFFQVQTTKEAHQTIEFRRYLKGLKPYVTIKALLSQCSEQISQLSGMIKHQLDYNTRIKINNLVINRVYARDNLQNFYNADLGTINDFLWKIHFKFFLNEVDYITEEEAREAKMSNRRNWKVPPKWYDMKQDQLAFARHYELNVAIVQANMPYGYEFLASKERLIITPLTDRCFQSLLLALHYDYGGAPVGPAGTGKTETVKELAKKIARPCFVFNCSSTLDFEAMCKFFKGVSASGLWTCFDEFNRIKIHVLSVVSQLINVIQNAKRERATEIVIDTTVIQFKLNSAIFITMNPFSHGRTILPDNIKSLFRQVTMNMPNIGLIAEIVLYSAGFIGAKNLSQKVVRIFELATDQMSSQIHYDFSLRTIKTILLYACKLKMQALNVQTKEDQENDEAQMKVDEYLRKFKKQFSQDDSQEEESCKSDTVGRLSNFYKKSKVLIAQQNGLQRQNLHREFQLQEGESSISSTKIKKSEVSSFESDTSTEYVQKTLQSNASLDVIIKNISNTDEQTKSFENTKLNEDFVREQLGINKRISLLKEDELEESIIRKAISDMIQARLLQIDAIIFENVCQDVFNKSTKADKKKDEMFTLVQHKLLQKSMYNSEEYIQNVLNLYSAINRRHGVMVIGQPVTGKTTIIKLLLEVINEINAIELKTHLFNFQRSKAHKLGIKVRIDEDSKITCNTDEQTQQLLVTDEELGLVMQLCKYKKISSFSINPKSMPIIDLFGSFNDKTREWTDGALTSIMRQQSQEQGSNRQIINFDGPIEPDWVENLNSVLDDNKVLNLVTGETIKLMPTTTVLLETVDLKNCSPATISRCAMIYLRDQTLPRKSQVNSWLKCLPPVLKGQVERMDQLVNSFVNEAMEIFLKREKMIYYVGKEWALATFQKVFEALISDYRNPRYEQYNYSDIQLVKDQLLKENEDPLRKLKAKKEAIINLKLANSIMKNSMVPLLTTSQDSFDKTTPSVAEPAFKFSYNDEMFVKSIENRDLWMDQFFFVSLVWAFGSLLRDQSKLEFDFWLKTMIKSKDTYKKSKLDEMEAHTEESVEGLFQPQKSTEALQSMYYEPTEDFTLGNLNLLVGKVPFEISVFDVYFDIYTNQWLSWKDYYHNMMMQTNIMNRVEIENSKQSDFYNIFLPTQDTVKYNFLFDLMISSNQSFIVIGKNYCGKSRSIEELMNKLASNKKIMIEMMCFSNYSTSESTKVVIQRNLPRRRGEYLCPFEGMKFYLMIEDINQGNQDQYSIQNANELLREIFNYSGWFDAQSLKYKKILDLSVCATMSVREQSADQISGRLGWHLAGIGFYNTEMQHLTQIFSQILDNTVMMNWHKSVATPKVRDTIIGATLNLYQSFNNWVKPSPANYLNHISFRHLFKIIFGITEINPTFCKKPENIAGAWLHEVSRTLVDRFLNRSEQSQVYGLCRELCTKVFQIDESLLPTEHFEPLFTYLNSESNSYMEIRSKDKVITHIQDGLTEYNQIHYRQPINLVIFSYFAMNIVKINRGIKQGGSNTFIVALEGVGAKQMVALAVYMSGFVLQELTNDLSYSLKQWEFELKQMLIKCGLNFENQCLVIQEKEIAFPEILNNLDTLQAHGELLSAMTREECEQLLQQQRFKEKNSCGKQVGKLREPEDQQTLNIFRKNCLQYFRSALLLTPRSEILKQGLRQYSRLVGNSTVIWLKEWDLEGFEHVARAQLKRFQVKKNSSEEQIFEINHTEDVLKAMIKIYNDAALEATLYYEESDHFIYITPRNFENLSTNYFSIFCKRKLEFTSNYNKIQEGLDGLEKTKGAIEKIQERLDGIGPKLFAKQAQMENETKQLNTDYENIGKKMVLVLAEEKEKVFLSDQAREIQEVVDRQLREVVPILIRAVDGLQSLKQTDIEELKSFPRPPEALKALLKAVCIILKVKPDIIVDPLTMKETLDYWNVSKGPDCLGNPSIVRLLSNIDPKLIDAQIIQQLDALMESDSWDYNSIERASLASEGLFRWVLAIKNYCVVYKACEPYRNRIEEANRNCLFHLKQIEEARDEIKTIEANLKQQKVQLIRYDAEIRVFQKQIDDLILLSSKAARMTQSLQQEKQRWNSQQKLTLILLGNLEGDCLIASAMVNYLAPFPQVIRDRLFLKWKQLCIDSGIQISNNLNFNQFFGVPIQVKMWLENELQNDTSSIQNAIILKLSNVQTILIDPQQMANRWLKRQLVEKKIIILNQDTSDFITQLKFCLKNGRTIIVENVGEKIIKALFPIFRMNRQLDQDPEIKIPTAETTMSEDSVDSQIIQEDVEKMKFKYPTVKVDWEVTEVHPNFAMYITSVAKCPDFGSELSFLANFINFTVTPEACQQQIISQIIEQLETEMYNQQKSYQSATVIWIKDLLRIEDEMVETLRKGITAEHEVVDECIIEQLASSRILTKKINHSLKEIAFHQKKIVKASAKYLPVAERATTLYFLLTDLHKLNKMYQFTHSWFFQMFGQVMRGFDKNQNRDKDDLNEINDKFTRYFFKQVCQCIFEKDKTTFSFLIAYRILDSEITLDKKLVSFFIKGPNHIEKRRKVQIDSKLMTLEEIGQIEQAENKILEARMAAAPWISKNTWLGIEKLSQITPFDQINAENEYPNLLEHVTHNSEQWRTYLYQDEASTAEGVVFAQNVQENSDGDPEEGGVVDVEANIEEIERRKKAAKVSHFTEQRTKLTTIRTYQSGMPGNYEAYHKVSQRERQMIQEQAIKMEKLEAIKKKKRSLEKVNKFDDSVKNLLDKKQKLLNKMQGEFEIDRIFRLDLSDYANSDSDYEPPKQRGDFLELSEDEYEIINGVDLSKPTNTQEDDKLAETIINGVPEYNCFKIKPTDFELKQNKERTLLVNQDLIRLAVVRVFKPECFLMEIKGFIIKYLDRRYHNPPAFDFFSVLPTLTKHTPCLLMTGQNVNAYQELNSTRKSAYSESKLDCFYQPLGSCSNSEIAKLIIKCACKGEWLLLDNLHLQTEIIPNLEKFLQNIMQGHYSYKKNLKAMLEGEIEAIIKFQDEEIEAKLKEGNPYYEMIQKIQDPLDPIVIAQKAKKDNEIQERKNKIYATLVSHRKGTSQQAVLKRLEEIEKLRAQEVLNCQEPSEPSSEELAMKDLHLPTAFQFTVSKNFRIFLSTNPESTDIPITFARMCTKVSLELPTQIKLNALKSFNGQKNEALQKGGPRRKEYQKLFFSLTILHAVINQRERFGNFGWSRPYQFAPSDLTISLRELGDVCVSEQAMFGGLPIKLIRYLVTQINYGGRVTDQNDRKILKTLVKTFLNEDAYSITKFEIDNFLVQDKSTVARTIGGFKAYENESIARYAFDLTGFYYYKFERPDPDEWNAIKTKEGGKVKHYSMANNFNGLSFLKNHVHDVFPDEDLAEVFGLHQSATLNAYKVLANRIMTCIYVNQFIVKLPPSDVLGGSAEVTHEQQIEFQAFLENLKFLLSKIPAKFDRKMIQRRAAITFSKPMNTLLNKEVERYNNVIEKVSDSLYGSIATLEGIRKLDKTTEETLNALRIQMTPQEWIMQSYPCHKSLALFVENLQERVKYIHQLLEEAMEDDSEASDFDVEQHQQEKKFTTREFWLPGFFDQKSFLAAICQETARKQNSSIDRMQVQFSVMRQNEPRLKRRQAMKQDTYYVYGLKIYGAQWSDAEQDIKDVNPKTDKLIYPMPYFKLKVVKIPALPKAVEKVKTQFICPFYVTTGRNRILNCPADEQGQWIADIPLPVKEFMPGFWVKRSVCLVCYCEDDI